MMQQATVHIVDDDPSVRGAVGRLIRSAGYRARAYASADEFLVRESSDGPGCLVLDLRMPGTDGLELQEKLVASGCELPIVFVTGHGDIPASVRAIKAGALDFLTKPFDDAALLDAIRRGLAQYEKVREESERRMLVRKGLASLTPREREVFDLVAAGRRNKQIGVALGISEKTVKVHRGRVMEKMRAESLADLVRMADVRG